MRRLLPSLGVAVFFVLITLGFFWRALIVGNVYFPLGGDFVSFNYPQNVFGVQSLQRGENPLWNPLVSSGAPYAADPNIGFLYPLKWLFAIALPGFSYREMEWLVALHFCLSALFMYALARDLGASRVGGVIAGFAFMLSGFMIGQIEHPNIILSATWLPLALLFFRRAILFVQWHPALWAGFFLALAVLGGHQQYPLLMILWMGLWLVGYWLFVTRKNLVRDTGTLLLALVVATGAAAIQILPSLELISESSRGHLSAAEASALNLPLRGWTMFILPHWFGPNALQFESLWNGYGNMNEVYGYVGIVALFLAIVGIAIRGRSENRLATFETWFLVAMAILALLLGLGNDAPLYAWAYALFPFLRFLRVPGRFVFWFDASVPLLVAFGIEFFRTAPKSAARKLWRTLVIAILILLPTALIARFVVSNTSTLPEWLLGARLNDLDMAMLLLVGLALALAFSRWMHSSRTLLIALVVALLTTDLFAAQNTLQFTTHNPFERFDHPQIVEFLRRELGDYRIDVMPDALDYWEPLNGLVYDLPMMQGLPWNPFDLSAYEEFRGAARPNSRAYDFLGGRFLIAPKVISLSTGWRLRFTDDPTVNLYENTRASPRALIVFHSIVEPNRARMLESIQSDAIDLKRVVVLESGTPMSKPDAIADARITASSNNRVVVDATSSQDGYLIMSDAYYPGWRVWVDDVETKLLRADYAFRAVAIPSGEHRVRFEFDSLLGGVGALVSAVSWGTLVIALGAEMLRKMPSIRGNGE